MFSHEDSNKIKQDIVIAAWKPILDKFNMTEEELFKSDDFYQAVADKLNISRKEAKIKVLSLQYSVK